MLVRPLAVLAVSVAAAAQSPLFVHVGRLDHLPAERRAVVDAAAADLDGDGHLDLALLQSGALVLLRGSRSGHFDEWHREAVDADARLGGVAVLDLDGDGRRDVLFAVHGGASGLVRNLGGGAFARGPTPVGGAVRALVAGDVDGDGDDDVFAGVGNNPGTGGAAGQSRLFRNDGGVLVDVTATRLPVETKNVGAAAFADVDNDGDLDLVLGMAAHYLGPSAGDELWRNDGTGTFVRDAAAFAGDPVSSLDLALGDVDGDGDVDLVVPHEVLGNPPFDRGVFLLRNDGLGRFAFDPGALPAVAEPCFAVALCDVDGDGDLDLAFGGGGSAAGGLTVLHNDGSGAFAGPSRWLPGVAPSRIVAGDLDARAGVDLLVGERGGVTARRAHLLIGDGIGGFVDATEPMPFGSPGGAAFVAGDFDGDGDPDLLQAVPGATPALAMFLNDGDGPLREVTATHVPPLVGAVVGLDVVDLDGDAREDAWVVLRGGGSETLTMLRAGPGGVLAVVPAAAVPPVGGRLAALATADLDRDGLLDVVFRDSYGIHVWRGVGPLAWQDDPRPVLASGLGDFALGDVDGDGVADLVAKAGAHLPSGRILVYRTDARGVPVFDAEVRLPAVAVFQGRGVQLADADRDGDLDLFVLSNAPTLFTNDGTGRFALAGPLPIPTATLRDDRVVDVDEDGDPDIVGGTSTAEAYLNDGAGAFRVASREVFDAGLGAIGRGVWFADVDGDGDPDLWAGAVGGAVEVIRNTLRQTHVPWLHERGHDARIVIFDRRGTAPAPHTILPAVALRGAHVPFAPWGVLRLELASFVPLLAVTVPPAEGRVALDFVTPNDPGLVGLVLHVQTVHVGGPGAPASAWRLGNHTTFPPIR